jgi:hypothetical protein
MENSMRIWASVVGATLALTACDKIETHGSRELKTQKDKVSYVIGVDIGRSFKQQNLGGADIDLEKVRIGIQDAMTGAKPALPDSVLQGHDGPQRFLAEGQGRFGIEGGQSLHG